MTKSVAADVAQAPAIALDERIAADLAALRAGFHGELLLPADAGYDETRGAYNVRVDQRPAAIAIPATASDVAAVLAYARAHGLTVAPQRTGHNAAPLGSLASTILLRTDRMTEVVIDAGAHRATVGAGAKWADVVPAASELGLIALHGSTGDVSVAGYVLGGGVGWYGRKHGLASNHVTGFEVVTADGVLRRVDAETDADLFWALRGGGGNFGIVCAVEIELFEAPAIYAGHLFFPWERSAEVLKAWRAWTETVPEEITSVARILQIPPMPDVPEPLRGKQFAVVEAYLLGSAEQGAELLAPIRALGPVMDTFAMVPPVACAEMHMDPPQPIPYASNHAVLSGISDQAIDALVAVVGPGSGSELVNVEIRHLGGAMGRIQDGHGALGAIDGEYLIFGVGVAPVEPAAEAVEARTYAMIATVGPHVSGQYLNFAEHKADPARFFSEETYARLRDIRAQVDPEGIFRANHSIPVR